MSPIKDVLFGRGAPIDNHPGNQRYRLSVMAQKSAYVATTRKKDKRAIALNIMQELHNLQPPGRFLIEACRDGRSGSILSKNGCN